jgi:hypothetical protein
VQPAVLPRPLQELSKATEEMASTPKYHLNFIQTPHYEFAGTAGWAKGWEFTHQHCNAVERRSISGKLAVVLNY